MDLINKLFPPFLLSRDFNLDISYTVSKFEAKLVENKSALYSREPSKSRILGQHFSIKTTQCCFLDSVKEQDKSH